MAILTFDLFVIGCAFTLSLGMQSYYHNIWADITITKRKLFRKFWLSCSVDNRTTNSQGVPVGKFCQPFDRIDIQLTVLLILLLLTLGPDRYTAILLLISFFFFFFLLLLTLGSDRYTPNHYEKKKKTKKKRLFKYIKNFTIKNPESFQIKILIFFHISA